jgi:hypothetical protein
MQGTWKIAAPISAVLTLATWIFFSYSPVTTSSEPLSASQTTFVFAFWFAIVAGLGWVLRRCRKNSKKDSGKSS